MGVVISRWDGSCKQAVADGVGSSVPYWSTMILSMVALGTGLKKVQVWRTAFAF